MLARPSAAVASAVWRPVVTVATVVERDGRFLFVEERVRGALVLNQPAGHLEPDESLLEAAVRETLEESAWEVELTGLVGIYQRRRRHDGEMVLRFTFSAKPVRERTGAKLDQGIERALWLAPAEMNAFALRGEVVRRSLNDYHRRAPLPLDCVAALDLGPKASTTEA